MRLQFIILVTICTGACAPQPSEPERAAASIEPAQANPADWGPAYAPGMEVGPAAAHLSQAFAQAEAFLAKQAFAKDYAKRACGGGGERFVDVQFALLSDTSGKTLGVVRVDTESNKCVWLGVVKQ